MRPWVARAFSTGMRVFLLCKALGNAAGNGETATTSAKAAAKRRQNAAHGVSRGLEAGRKRAPQGRKITPWAAFWRRFAAAYIERRLTSLYPTNKACSTLLLLTVLTALSGCRQDMHDQPRFKPLRESDFYADLRSARPPVEGTVARGQLHEDAYFYGGKIGNNPGDYMPFAVTADVLARGQERYNIYCAPCHSRLG